MSHIYSTDPPPTKSSAPLIWHSIWHLPVSYTDILYLQLSLWPFYVFEHFAGKINWRAEQRPEQWLSQLWVVGHAHQMWALHYMCIPLSKYLSLLGHLQCPLCTAWLAEVLTEQTKNLAKHITRSRHPEKETKSPKLSERKSTMSMSVVVFQRISHGGLSICDTYCLHMLSFLCPS